MTDGGEKRMQWIHRRVGEQQADFPPETDELSSLFRCLTC